MPDVCAHPPDQILCALRIGFDSVHRVHVCKLCKKELHCPHFGTRKVTVYRKWKKVPIPDVPAPVETAELDA